MLEVIAGYDSKDELTAFSIGRLPSAPYRSFANERTLNGFRIASAYEAATRHRIPPPGFGPVVQ